MKRCWRSASGEAGRSVTSGRRHGVVWPAGWCGLPVGPDACGADEARVARSRCRRTQRCGDRAPWRIGSRGPDGGGEHAEVRPLIGEMADTVGVSKSAVSRRSLAVLKEQERRLDAWDLLPCGIHARTTRRGLRRKEARLGVKGASENAEVSALLAGRARPGPGQAAAVRDRWLGAQEGDREGVRPTSPHPALPHVRNVLGHLPKDTPQVKAAFRAAMKLDAKQGEQKSSSPDGSGPPLGLGQPTRRPQRDVHDRSASRKCLTNLIDSTHSEGTDQLEERSDGLALGCGLGGDRYRGSSATTSSGCSVEPVRNESRLTRRLSDHPFNCQRDTISERHPHLGTELRTQLHGYPRPSE